MSINILKEFLIHFHTFRNVDLINQGVYQIRVRINYIDKNIKFYALPYFYIESKDCENSQQTDEQSIKPHKLISNHISENNIEYVTKSFLIRYSDEEVEIDEFCYFRLEIPFAVKPEIMYNIEFELYLYESSMSNGKDKLAQNILNNVEFKSVSQQMLVINYNGQGFIESHTPIVFSDNYSSMLNSSVHMVVLDHKLRINNIRTYTGEQNLNSANNSANTSQTTQTINLTKKNSILETRNVHSLIQFFLEEKDCLSKIEKKIIDELYDKYVIPLLKNYVHLRDKYHRLVNKLLDEKLKSEFPFFVFIQPLSVYYDEKDNNIVNIPNDEHLNFLSLSIILGTFSNRISDHSSEYVSSRIIVEINYVGGQIYQLWHKYIELIRYFPTQSNFILLNEHLLKYKDDLSKFLKKSIVNVTETANLLLPIENNIAELNKNNAKEMRSILIENFIRPPVKFI